MKVPYSWLKEYVDIDLSAEELEEKLFGCGFEVEELIDLGGEISRVVVGEVLSCEKVEGTHLFICQVNCGEHGNPIQIVTGAPNVYAGMHTPAALDGSTLPGGIVIKAKPLKGIPSAGMLCSGEELGLTRTCIPARRYTACWTCRRTRFPARTSARWSDWTTMCSTSPSRRTARTARACWASPGRLRPPWAKS